MKDLFFPFAVIGPIASQRFAIAEGCAQCRASQDAPPRCTGFGPGCLGFRTPSREPLTPR
jgi:hypothetical protein